MKPIFALTLILSPLASLVVSAEPPPGKVLRAGMIGLDTSQHLVIRSHLPILNPY